MLESRAKGGKNSSEPSTPHEIEPAARLLKEANEQLVLATLRARDLADSAEAFRLLVDSVKEYAIFMLDPTGHVKTWNAGAERIKGYAAREIIGQHFSVFYPREDVLSGKCERGLAIASSEGRFEDEGLRVRKDGSTFLANVVITALRNREGRVIGFGKVTRDLTDRVRMEQDRVVLARSEQAEHTKDEFLAIMGHELRNPLAPMVTAVHLLKLRGGRNCGRELAILDRQLELMKRLVDDLLDVSRARQDKIFFDPKPLEIGEVLANAVDVASPMIRSKRHRIELDVPARDLLVSVDAERMAQVFGNLLNNAAKYTDCEGEIRVRASGDDNNVTVTIEDTGIGIAPDLMPRIFELFAQGRQGLERRLGGLGIGLAIAHHLVVAHGGEISAESEGAGRGSRFTVRLPRLPSSERARPTSVPPPSHHAAVRRCVLLVDDNVDSCEMIQCLLEGLGHDTRVAQEGATALALLHDFTPDIVFLDIGLPDMDGFEVVKRMRQIPACARIPIMALSGYATQADRRRALEAGFTDHFAKPVDIAFLERVIERGSGEA